MKKLKKYNINYFTGKIGKRAQYHLFQRLGQPIFIKASFAAGSRFDTKPGIAHFLEHMLLAGSKNYPNKRLLVTPLENIGSSIGASTNTDFINISLELAERKDLPIALSILDEVINKPLFEDKTVETERGSILTEIKMRYHNRAIHVLDIADKLVYQGTPCGNTVIGSEESVNSINKNDLVSFYKKVFKSSAINWSISGDIEEKDIIEALDKLHNPQKTLKNTFTSRLPLIREDTVALEIFEDEKVDLYFGFRTDLAEFSDIINLNLIFSYLAQGRGCKLQEELRYKQGLIYGCGGENFTSFDRGDWYIITACSAENTQKVIDIILKEITLIKEIGISEEELQLVKNKLIKGNIIKLQTARSWAEMASKASFMSFPEDFLVDNYEKMIGNVSIKSIINTAKKYFSNKNWYLAMCGPQSLEKIKVVLK